MDRRLLRPLLLITVVLIVPLVLLAVRGESFAGQLRAWQENPPPRATLAAMVVAVLAADIVLPVPSGPISTLAGGQLGVIPGAAASTLGMTIGAVAAFALARGASPFRKKLRSSSADSSLTQAPANDDLTAELQESPERMMADHGPWLLIVTRPLPVVAEAAVLLVGGLQMPWRTFVPIVTAANLAISLTYALVGKYASAQGWLPLAVCGAIALPVMCAIVYARARPRKGT